MIPVILEEAGNAPQHAKRLDGASGFSFSHVSYFPAELIKDAAHDLLRRLIITADKHRRLAALELRVICLLRLAAIGS